MAPSPAKSLERYDLLDRVAVGGMAEVFRAKAYGAHGFEKTLAIKRILPELARDGEFEQRFIAEAKLAVGLTHANVVQIFDFGRLGGSLFIAMEFVDGLDLAALLEHCRDRGEPVRLTAAFQIAIDLVRGLDFAHRAGVVHRDVSPSNILLSRAGEVKIADFGIALALDERNRVAGDERRIMGKWRYMSPEQTAARPLDPRSDLFSAATVMHELFTGVKLFPGASAEEIIESIQGMPIPRASTLRPGLPAELDDILERALHRSPAERTQSAAEMLRALTEQSYRSSLVATNLDVAEVVEDALGQGADRSAVRKAGGGIDDLIRAQLLGDSGGTQRRTSVVGDDAGDHTDDDAGEASPGDPFASTARAAGGETTSSHTLVRRGVGGDGMTVLELDTIAANPVALRSGARPTQPPPIAAAPKAIRAWQLVVGALVAAGLAALAFVWLGASPAELEPVPAPVVAAPADAGPEVGVVTVESIPAGAQIWVDGAILGELSPTTFELSPGRAHTIELSLAGHRPWRDDGVEVVAGESLRLVPTLAPQRAVLIVRTRPEGATVTLDGERLGTTPLGPMPVAPGPDRVLRIAKDGFKAIEERVDLVDDGAATLDRRLESAIVYGKININIPESWAHVSLGRKQLGTVSGSVRLPVGTHRLLLSNPQSGKRRTVSVEVFADRVAFYEFTL